MSSLDERIRKIFDSFDDDKNGKIDAQELKQAMDQLGRKLTESQINEMIKEADLDGDGKIDFEEFKRMMTK